MNIAIIDSMDLGKVAPGGTAEYIRNVILYGCEHSFTLYGACEVGKCEFGKEYRICKDGLDYKFIPISDNAKRPISLYYGISLRKYLKELEKFDLIISQRVEFTVILGLNKNLTDKIVGLIHGSSVYTTLHWGKIKSNIYFQIEKKAINIANKTFIVLRRKEFGVPYYKEKYKKAAKKIDYFRIPIDMQMFHSSSRCEAREILELDTKSFIVMFGGRVVNDPKRVFLFPQILRRLVKKNSSTKFLLVGDGEDRETLLHLFDREGLMENVINVGQVHDRKKLALYLNACDVNINISEFEGTCTSSLEAICCGIPVVSTDVGDINFFVNNGNNGYVVPNNDSEQIVNDVTDAIIKIQEKRYCMDNQETKKYEVKEAIDEFLNKIIV